MGHRIPTSPPLDHYSKRKAGGREREGKKEGHDRTRGLQLLIAYSFPCPVPRKVLCFVHVRSTEHPYLLHTAFSRSSLPWAVHSEGASCLGVSSQIPSVPATGSFQHPSSILPAPLQHQRRHLESERACVSDLSLFLKIDTETRRALLRTYYSVATIKTEHNRTAFPASSSPSNL